MSKPKLTRQIRSRIDEAVQHFVANQSLFESFAQALLAYFQNDPVLAPYIHFIKYRLKDPQNLRKKLIRKARQGDIIDKSNLFARITDLAGISEIIRSAYEPNEGDAPSDFGSFGRTTTSASREAQRELLGCGV